METECLDERSRLRSPQPIGRDEFFRVLLRTGVVRCLWALTILGLSYLVSRFIWEARDFVAAMLIVAVAIFSLFKAWEVLPIAPETRARWAAARDRWAKLRKRFWSYRWRNSLWIGAGMCINPMQQYFKGREVRLADFALPVLFSVIGAIALIRWRRWDRHHPDAIRLMRRDAVADQ